MSGEVGNWESIIKNWDSLLAKERKVVIRSLRLGIPRKYRSEVWALLAGAHRAKSEAGFEYQEYVEKESDSARVIKGDVPRTFKHDVVSKVPNFYESLRNVLTAYSNIDTEIGYVQGMNFLAGMLLLYQDEETAFWSFYGLMMKWHTPYRNFFMLRFPKLMEMAELVDWMVEKKFPEVHRGLKLRRLNSIFFVPQWFNTCFVSADFDLELNTFIFDQFLAFGIPPLLSFGMATISLVQHLIKEHDFEEFMSVISNPGRANVMHYRQKINIEWAKEWITTSRYHKLIQDMREEKQKQSPC